MKSYRKKKTGLISSCILLLWLVKSVILQVKICVSTSGSYVCTTAKKRFYKQKKCAHTSGKYLSSTDTNCPSRQ